MIEKPLSEKMRMAGFTLPHRARHHKIWEDCFIRSDVQEAVSQLKKEILPFIPKPRHKYALLKIEEVFGEVKP